MAIGTDPEIGRTFTLWGQMNETMQQAWFHKMRTEWADNLMAGYAVTVYPTEEAINRHHQYWEQHG